MACQVEGGGTISPVKAMKDEWAKQLAQGYGAMEPPARQEIADMPMRWAALRYAWPGLPEEQRKDLKAQWGRGKEVQEIAAAVTKLRLQTAAASGNNSDKSAAQIMDEMQRNNRNFTMLSNISMQMHQARMTVAYNMGGGWRYDYRR
jgi:hypothetical protein